MRTLFLTLALSATLHGALLLWFLTRQEPPVRRAAERHRVASRVPIRLRSQPAPQLAEPEPPRPLSPAQGSAASAPARAVARKPAGSAKGVVESPRLPDLATQATEESARGAMADIGSVDLTLHPPAPPRSAPRVQAPEAPKPGPSLSGDLRPRAGGGFSYEDSTFSAEILRDGQVKLQDDAFPDTSLSGGQISLSVDITDAIMRAAGEDPYRYEKAKFLDATREMRLGMARDACRERLSESVLRVREQLEGIWANPRASPQEKRRLIFELWDECAEDGPLEIVKAAELVRATVISFVNQKMPGGSAAAYDRDELMALNRRRSSKRVFAPYAGTNDEAPRLSE